MLRGWIVGIALQWADCTLTGNTALELLLHFLRAVLLERVCAAA
jgi:hypothetical protein